MKERIDLLERLAGRAAAAVLHARKAHHVHALTERLRGSPDSYDEWLKSIEAESRSFADMCARDTEVMEILFELGMLGRQK